MAITFPLALASLADLLPIERVDWNELRQETHSGLGTGEFLTHNLGPVLWEADVQLRPMYHVEAEQMRARVSALDGSTNAFYLYNPRMRYPQSDPTGSILGASAVTVYAINANRKALRLTGLPIGYVITIGDYLAITYDTSRRALLQAVEGATADGSGITPEFEVRPHLRPGIVTTNPVTLKNPAAKVKMMPGTVRVERAEDPLFSRVRFVARQTLAKD
ncbi:MAG: hypothetical protein WEB63_09510 [Cucumibacter sp.]